MNVYVSLDNHPAALTSCKVMDPTNVNDGDYRFLMYVFNGTTGDALIFMTPTQAAQLRDQINAALALHRAVTKQGEAA